MREYKRYTKREPAITTYHNVTQVKVNSETFNSNDPTRKQDGCRSLGMGLTA